MWYTLYALQYYAGDDLTVPSFFAFQDMLLKKANFDKKVCFSLPPSFSKLFDNSKKFKKSISSKFNPILEVPIIIGTS